MLKLMTKTAVACFILLLLSCSVERNTSVKNTSTEAEHSLRVPVAHPEIWPENKRSRVFDPEHEAKIKHLLQQMTLEEKVGQVIQADIASVTPEDVKKYNLGSVLNGGNSAPRGDNRVEVKAWLSLADDIWIASTDRSDGGVGIPAIWGTDAVHGHNNIVGATIFPHNIGLGAMRDPELMKRIGEVTAKEILVTGLDWTFAPTIAVARDDRWGRTYESFSEDPALVSAYAGQFIEGLQGKKGEENFLGEGKLIATAKHFLGDGGTVGGVDQGDNINTEEQLRDIHVQPYVPAIEQGVQVVMASFNSWHGKKMHGNKQLLTDVLVDQMGFNGFVVGDWDGHGQVAGCSNTSCPQAFNAGIDMFMAPASWKGLYYSLIKQVRSGEITEDRLNQAVARILRVKLRSGLFDAGLPSLRKLSGRYELLGSPKHRAVAREAVRKSLVLLKNNEQVLPLSSNMNVLICGDGANNIAKQSGGWTLSWQGTGNKNSDFPNGTSIYEGIRDHVESANGTVQLDVNGNYENKPDVAIVVFGEDPYAEMVGDREHLAYGKDDAIRLLQRFKQEGIATVSVFLSGRPMWVNREINASDAFVAAWLPGAEGAGLADLLFRQADGSVLYDFTGRLSFSWPKDPLQTNLNIGDQPYEPQFEFGYGLSYADTSWLGTLLEDSSMAEGQQGHLRALLVAGDPLFSNSISIVDEGGSVQLARSEGVSPKGHIRLRQIDSFAQEDTALLSWNKHARFLIEIPARDLSRQANAHMALKIKYQVEPEQDLSETRVRVGMHCGNQCEEYGDVSAEVKRVKGLGWQEMLIGLDCFAAKGVDMKNITVPFALEADGPAELQLMDVEIVSTEAGNDCLF